MSYLTRRMDFFLRENNFEEFCIQKKIVMLVIACINNVEFFTAHTVLLSICQLSSMKAVVVDFNA